MTIKLMMMSTIRKAWRGLPQPVRHSFQGIATEAVQHLGTMRGASRTTGTQASGAVAIMGLHRAILGIGEAARSLREGMHAIGVPTRLIDVTAQLQNEVIVDVKPHTGALEDAGTVVTVVNPPQLLYLTAIYGGDHLRNRRHIAHWSWETAEMPQRWRPAFSLVDEVWAPSNFTADAFRAHAPKHCQVRVVPFPVYLGPRGRADRARFGLPADRPVAFTAFDARSSLARKNPEAAIRAFAESLKVAPHDGVLLFKVVGSEGCPEGVRHLRALTNDMPNVIWMEHSFDREDMADLIASVDIILSLHRSEGYGLLLAQGMMMGKPVVATNWSGNVAFMNESTSALVDAKLVPVRDPQGIYKGGVWADPDVEQAAHMLANLFTDAEECARIGGAAARAMSTQLGLPEWSERVGRSLNLPRAKPGRVFATGTV